MMPFHNYKVLKILKKRKFDIVKVWRFQELSNAPKKTKEIQDRFKKQIPFGV